MSKPYNDSELLLSQVAPAGVKLMKDLDVAAGKISGLTKLLIARSLKSAIANDRAQHSSAFFGPDLRALSLK